MRSFMRLGLPVLCVTLVLLCALVCAATPANDNFANAQALSATLTGTVFGSNVGASNEANEPAHGNNVGGASVWFIWTAPTSGSITFDTVGSNFDTTLAAYTGIAVSALTLAPGGRTSNDDLGAEEKYSPYPQTSRIKFTAQAGQTYRIAVDGYNAAQGDLTLRWTPTPANDNFAAASVLTGASGTLNNRSNVGATREASEPDGMCATVWYTWTAPSDGRLSVTALSNEFALLLYAYTDTALSRQMTALARSDGAYQIDNGVRFPVTAGVTYHLAVDCFWYSGWGAFNLAWAFTPAPGNDDFAQAQTISGTSGSVSGTTLGATREANEPQHVENENDRSETSVWYKWVAPSTGLFTFDLHGSALTQSLLAIYTGSALSSLTPVAKHNLETWDHVRFRATAGVTYYLAVDHANGSYTPLENTFTLHWATATAPANDNFAAAQALGGAASGSVTGSNVGATRESSEPFHPSGGSYCMSDSSVWYTWTAPSSRGYTFATTTTSGTYDHRIVSVYTGSTLSALTAAPYARYYFSGGNSGFRFVATTGVTYRIVVDGYYGAEGPFTLAWSPAPANDNFAQAQTISGASGTVTGTNAGATSELYEPHSSYTPASIWYNWTAPSSGNVTFDTNGSAINNRLTIYTGTSLQALTELAFSYGQSCRLTFVASAGTVYHISLEGDDDNNNIAEGALTLHWAMVSAPPNDNFANAQLLNGNSGSVTGSNVGATVESGEISGMTGTVWYKWVAPGNGRISFTIPASNFNHYLYPYTGAAVDAITYLGSADRFTVIGGTTYYVQVGSWDSSRGSFTLQWQYSPAPANDDFANATVLATASGTKAGTTNGATSEPNEYWHSYTGDYGSRISVWYNWTAPSDGRLSVKLADSVTNYAVAVYTGSVLETLTTRAQRDNAYETPDGVRLPVTAGVTYHIAIDTYPESDYTLHWTFTPAPANDDFADARVITGLSGTINGSNNGATPQTGQPDAVDTPADTSVWYRWTAPSDETVTFSATTDFPAIMVAYRGETLETLTALQLHQHDPHDCRVSIKAQAGETYYIMLTGQTQNFMNYAEGAITLQWAPTTQPDNDDFANAQLISGVNGTVSGTNVFATREDGEPLHGWHWGNSGGVGGKSVWYRWVAEHTGKVTFIATSDSYYNLVSVYSGSTVDAITHVNCQYLNYGQLCFTAVEGQTYNIAVDGSYGEESPFQLNWTLALPPSNDDLATLQALTDANATILPDGTRQVTGYNTGAAKEPNEPNHAGDPGGASVWFSLTIPHTGGFRNVSLSLAGTDFSHELAVYTNPSGGALTMTKLQPLVSATGFNQNAQLAFTAAPDTTYYIAVDGQAYEPYGTGSNYAYEGNLVLSWKEATVLTVDASATRFSEQINGIAATGTVHLSTAQANGVYVQLTSSNPLLIPSSSVFIPAGDTSASFDIYVNDNAIDEPDRQVQITATCVGMIDGVATFTVLDDDTAGIKTDLLTEKLTSEEGRTAVLYLSLNSQPTANVSLTFTSSDITEGQLLDPQTGQPTTGSITLTFTPQDWNFGQAVTVTGINDALRDGDIAYSIITAAAVSTDPNYNGMNTPDVALTNIDDDTSPLAAVALSATPDAPQPCNAAITLTATPTGGVNLQHKFRAGYQDAAGWHWADLTDYTANAGYTWRPASARVYTVAVWTREVGHTANYDKTASLSYRIFTPLSAVALTVAPASPQLTGAKITLTAAPTGGYAVQYKFRVGYQPTASTWSWTDLTGYQSTPNCNWWPADARTYTLAVWARESGSAKSYDVLITKSYVIRAPLTALAVSATPASPQPIGTPITLKALPTGGANLEYKFRVGYQPTASTWNWTDLTGYTTATTCAWTPSEPRTYTILLYAREVGHTAVYDKSATLTFKASAPPITAVSLAALPIAPQRVNIPITLTATPTGGWQVEYKYRVGYQDAAGWHWTDLTAGYTTNTYVWTPTVARTYTLTVWAREVGSTVTYKAYTTLAYRVAP